MHTTQTPRQGAPTPTPRQVLCFALLLGIVIAVLDPRFDAYLSAVVVVHELLRRSFDSGEDHK